MRDKSGQRALYHDIGRAHQGAGVSGRQEDKTETEEREHTESDLLHKVQRVCTSWEWTSG